MKFREKITKCILITILVVAIVIVCYMVVNPNQGEGFTELYILDHNNNTTDYPVNVTQGSIEKINIGIRNNEYAQMNYTVKIKKDNQTLTVYNRTLENNEETLIPYYLDRTSTIGDDQTLDIELYMGNITNPYRTLTLRYNVV
ncbi:MAG: DUF1616 domain-containing protein [Methanosphaera sp.]|nr:DUF1616 domain-containing protein [Methanosphaera sp.]